MASIANLVEFFTYYYWLFSDLLPTSKILIRAFFHIYKSNSKIVNSLVVYGKVFQIFILLLKY